MARGGQRGYGNAGRSAYGGGTRGAQARAVLMAGGAQEVILATLALSGTLTVGTAASGVSISGATAGSTITFNIAGISVGTSGTTRAVSGTPATSGALTYVETLAGATGSPKSGALGTVVTGATLYANPVIVDADLNGGDIDDAYAFTFAAQEQKAGRWNVEAFTICGDNPKGAPAAQAIVNKLWLDNGLGTPPPIYQRQSLALNNSSTPSTFPQDIAAAFGVNKIYTDYPSALSAYRAIIAKYPDQRVSVANLGSFQNLADLIAAPADTAISPLTGAQLFDRIKVIAACANLTNSTNDYNMHLDDDAAITVMNRNTVPVIGTDNVPAEEIRIMAPWGTNSAVDPVQLGAEIYPGRDPRNSPFGRRSAYDPQVMDFLSGFLNNDYTDKYTLTVPGTATLTKSGSNLLANWAAGGVGTVRKYGKTGTSAGTDNNLQARYENKVAEVVTQLDAVDTLFWPLSAAGTGVNNVFIRDPDHPGFTLLLGGDYFGAGIAPTLEAAPNGTGKVYRFDGTGDRIHNNPSVFTRSATTGLNVRRGFMDSATYINSVVHNFETVPTRKMTILYYGGLGDHAYELTVDSTGHLIVNSWRSDGTFRTSGPSTAIVPTVFAHYAIMHDGSIVYGLINNVVVCSIAAPSPRSSPTTSARLVYSGFNAASDFIAGLGAHMAYSHLGTVAERDRMYSKTKADVLTRQGITLP